MRGPLIDLTHTLDSSISVYPGDPPCTLSPFIIDDNTVTTISCSSHSGTHIDAPSHFFPELETIDQLPLETFVRPVFVVDLEGKKGAREVITWENDLAPYEGRLKEGVALVIKTGWDQYWGTNQYFDHPYLDASTAEKLLSLGIRILAMDTLSPDQGPHVGGEKDGVDPGTGFGVHRVLLPNGCLIAENLKGLGPLVELQEKVVGGKGKLWISLMPLKLGKCDGSPVRALAWTE